LPFCLGCFSAIKKGTLEREMGLKMGLLDELPVGAGVKQIQTFNATSLM